MNIFQARNEWRKWWMLLVLGAAVHGLHAAPGFESATHGFSFDTGRWRGQIGANGKSFGLVPVWQKNQRLAASMGWLAVYRVFSDGRRYGAGAWDWPAEFDRQLDGSLVVRCAAATNRPFAFTGHYQWRDERTVDLEITVLPEQPLRGFEVFVASYFSPAFSNAMVVTRNPAGGAARLTPATRELGEWLMFPRDEKIVPLIEDGRWQLEPHPVKWSLPAMTAMPVAVRRAPASGEVVVVMGDPKECFALAMPYETEAHYSLYLSLFGRDLIPGRPAQARVRLQGVESAELPVLERVWNAFKQGAAD